MATIYFNNDAEFMNYFNSQEGKKVAKQLVRRAKASKGGVVGKSSGIEFSAADGDSRSSEKTICDEANRLRDLIFKWMRVYEERMKAKWKWSYIWGVTLSDTIYEVKESDVITDEENGSVSVYIRFNEDRFLKRSILEEWYPGSTFDEYVGDTLDIFRHGWEVKKDVWFKNIGGFGFGDGFDFVQKGIDEFNSNNPYNIKVELSDAFYK